MSFSVGNFLVSGDVLLLGLVVGMAYGLLAAGLVLIYRSSRIVNFAYGEIGGFGAAILGVACTIWHWPYWLGFALALACSAALGVASEVIVIRRLRAAPLVITVIATLGLGQVISIMSSIIDGSVRAGTSYPQPSGFPSFHAGHLLMTPAYTAILFVTPAVVIALTAFLRRGRLGLALRASAANPDTASLFGVLPGRMAALAWGLGGAVAAYTAVLVLPTRGFAGGDFLGPGLLLRGLACAVIARMVSLPIAFVAGIGLGVIEQLLLANYPDGGAVEMVIFVIILGALLLQRSRSGRGEDKGSWSVVESFRPLPASFRKVRSIRNLRWVVAATMIVIAVVVPELTTNSAANNFTVVAAFAIVGLSVVLVTGLGGQLSLGQFGIAAVCAAVAYWVNHWGAPFLVGLVAGAVAGAVLSLIIGLPAVRIRGLMLAVTTMSFALAAGQWVLQQPWMFGGGVSPKPIAIGHYSFADAKHYYWIAIALALVCLWLAHNFRESGLGRRVRAVRDNEEAARSFSINATLIKLQTFMVAGVIAGIGGALYGFSLSQDTASTFPLDLSIDAAAVAVIGGLGFLSGPVLGSLYIIAIPQFVPLDNAGLAATSAAWLLLILQVPGGVVSTLAPVRDRIVDALARQAGLDATAERAQVPAGGVEADITGLVLTERPRREHDGEVILGATGLTKRFGGLIAVHDLTIELRAGEILGLMGPNGAGKTTLFELLSGFNRPDAGQITFQGRDITDLSPEQRAHRGLIRSFQDAALFPTMTVYESILLALERSDSTQVLPALAGLGRRSEQRKGRRAEQLIATLGLSRYESTRIMALSTGTRRIAELACLIALEPVVLLLDEPTSGIAQGETEALGEVLRRVRAQLDLAMVIIEHDIPLLMRLADRVVAMESGQVLTVGAPAEVRADPRVVASYLGTDTRAIERSGLTSVPTVVPSTHP